MANSKEPENISPKSARPLVWATAAIIILLGVVYAIQFSNNPCGSSTLEILNYIKINHQANCSPTPPEADIRFEAALDPIPQGLVLKDETTGRLYLTFRFSPKLNDTNKMASIFLGFVSIYDEYDIPAGTKLSPTKEKCVSPCILARLWDWSDSPKIMRLGEPTSQMTHMLTADVPKKAENLRIYWRFYQSEAGGSNRCIINRDVPVKDPNEIPALKLVSKDGNNVNGKCYFDALSKVQHVTYGDKEQRK